MRITNNIYVLSGSYFAAVDNAAALGDVYGVRTPDGIVLIDCGEPVTGLAVINETLAYFDVADPITHLIVTHAHHDHCGGARELQEDGVIVIVGEEDAAYCVNGGVWGLYTPFDTEQSYPAFQPDITVSGDQKRDINGLTFEFIKIPGHTPGSMAVRVTLDDKTALFTGDALQPDGIFLNNVTFGWQGDPYFSRQAVVSSMMKLMDYETDMVLPGHGKVCVRNGSKLLRRAAQEAFTTMR